MFDEKRNGCYDGKRVHLLRCEGMDFYYKRLNHYDLEDMDFYKVHGFYTFISTTPQHQNDAISKPYHCKICIILYSLYPSYSFN